MTIRRLEDFALSIGAAVGLAQKGPRRSAAEARVTSMDVDLAATVERIGPGQNGVEPGALALRIGRPKNGPGGQPANFLRLSIAVRGERGEDIEVRLEGKLLGRYGKIINGKAVHAEEI